MLKITALIPTKNEALHIANAIDSVSWADEIIVVDSYSTDDTVAIAKQKGVRVIQRVFDTHARQKNWAIEQASHEWIFILDADERVTPELKAEIQGMLQNGPDKDAYWIGRRNHFMGQEVRYSGWQRDKVIRLFRKSNCRYSDKQVHEEIETTGTVGKLRNRLLHYTYRNLRHYLVKWDDYTWKSANDRAAKTPEVTLFHLWLKPSFSFMRHYFFQLGFLDGRVGFVISYMAATTVFMRYLKLWRLREDKNPAS